jgi:ATP-binding cassette subfamily B protein
MNYNLNELSAQQQKTSSVRALQKLLRLIGEERRNLLLALVAIVANSGLNLLGPFIIGHVIDTYIVHKNFDGVLRWAGILLGHVPGGICCRLPANKINGWRGTTHAV